MEQTNPLPNPPTPTLTVSPPPANPPLSKKPLLIIFLVVFIVILTSLNAYLFIKSQNQSKMPVIPPAPVIQASPTPTPDLTANWQIHSSPEMHFQIKYPNDVSVNSGIVNKQNNINISYKGKYQNNNMAWVDGITIDITYNSIPTQNNLVNLIDERVKKISKYFSTNKKH